MEFPPNQATYPFSSVSSASDPIWTLSSMDIRYKRPQLGDPKLPSPCPLPNEETEAQRGEGVAQGHTAGNERGRPGAWALTAVWPVFPPGAEPCAGRQTVVVLGVAGCPGEAPEEAELGL